jgi:hypothetical protein
MTTIHRKIRISRGPMKFFTAHFKCKLQAVFIAALQIAFPFPEYLGVIEACLAGCRLLSTVGLGVPDPVAGFHLTTPAVVRRMLRDFQDLPSPLATP